MKRKFIILLSILGLLSACQKYDVPSTGEAPGETEKTATVFTLRPQLSFQAGYEPMSKATADEDENETKFILLDTVRVIIAKNINSGWVVDTTFKWTLFTIPYTNQIPYKKNTELKKLTVNLRPGQYRIAVFLNPNNCLWNKELTAGKIIDRPGDPDFKRPFALRYGKQPENAIYNNKGMYYISHEVFAGTQDFEVKKTTDVHSGPEPNRITVPLTRKVSKLNFALNNTRSPNKGYNFGTTENWIYATLKSDPATGPFCNGIDVWGNTWYDPEAPFDSIKTCVSMHGIEYTGTDNNPYLLEMNKHSNIWAPYFFSDSGKEYRYSLEGIYLTNQSPGPQFKCKIPIFLTMKHNSINGVIFKCTDEAVAQPDNEFYPIITIIPVTNDNGELMKPTEVFPNLFYEFNH